jgi:hypothetical protein
MLAVNQPHNQSVGTISATQAPEARNPFMSQTIGKLAEALSKAQSEITNALKDKDNHFFKSTYADLASVWDACRDPLSKNGLSVTQPLSMDLNGRMILTTLLMHSSGEWISSMVPVVPVKQDPQSVGSAITYMRRFSLSALVGVAPSEKPTEQDIDDDDDGNAASGRGVQAPIAKAPAVASPVKPKTVSEAPKAPAAVKGPSPAQLAKLFALAKEKGLHNKQELKDWIANTFNWNDNKFSMTSLTQQEFQDTLAQLEKIYVSSAQDDIKVSDENFDQQDFTSSFDSGVPATKGRHPNAVPDPGLSEEARVQWFKNRKVD